MPLLYRADAKTEEGYPGIPRTILVDASHGAKSLWVGHLEIAPGAQVINHIHPDTEEAMVIVEGQLEAVLDTASSTARAQRLFCWRLFPRFLSNAWRRIRKGSQETEPHNV